MTDTGTEPLPLGEGATPGWTPQMTPEQVDAILALVVSLDSRMIVPDKGTADLRAKGWWKIIGEVHPDYAIDYVRDHYAAADVWPLAPGDLLQAWRVDQARRRAADEAQEDSGHTVTRAHPEVFSWLRRCLAAYRAGEDPTAVPRPDLPRLSDKANRWGRRCTYWRLCHCPHTNCRDGWADQETTRTSALDREYPAAVRCAPCTDALDDAEQRGIAKKPRGTGRRR